MKSEPLKPVPIPVSQRVRFARMWVMPPVVFGCAIILIAALWRENIGGPVMVGEVEPAVVRVSSHLPGIVTDLTVQRFEKVRAGQEIGTVLPADPKLLQASLDVVRAEIEELRTDPQRIFSQQRFLVDQTQLRLNWMRQRADLASARVQFELAKLELRRNEEMVKHQLVSESMLDLARANHDGLVKEIEELTASVAEAEAILTSMQTTNPSAYNNALLGPLGLQESRLKLAEAEFGPITLRAPIDGVISVISNRVGEAVLPGQAIVTISSPNPVRIVGYLRPPLRVEPAPGMKVEIRTRTMPRRKAETVITEVGNHFEMLPISMQSALRLATVEMGLPVEVALPSDLGVRGGELVDITLINRVD
jgi:Multidrug resistance efflux pump